MKLRGVAAKVQKNGGHGRSVTCLFAKYDQLAFPGGLTKQFELLEAGDPEAIEMAVRYLEADPWYFRSGYYKADMLRFLRKHPLSDDQSARLRALT